MEMLPTTMSCQPRRINNQYVAVGGCSETVGGIGQSWAVRWNANNTIEVLVDDGSFNLATGLSHAGHIVGFSSDGSHSRGWLLTPQPAAPPALALHLNQTAFQAGQTLRMALEIQNSGPAVTTDVYVGVILPDGNTVLWLTTLSPLDGVITSLSANPATFAPHLQGVTWPAGLHTTQQDFFTYTFHGLETPGTYHVLVGWTVPNSLQDGRIDDGDVLALAWAPIHVSRGATSDLYATVRAIQARHATQ